MEEAKLLRRLRRGDQRALEQAIRQYSGYVMTVIRNRSRGLLPPEDQEEVASDVFVVLWQRAAEIHAPTLRSYLGAVARNRTVDAMKKRQLSVPLEDNDIEIPDSAWACITKRALREDLAQAMDNTGEGHEKELKNGGMRMTLLQAEGKTGYFLVTNSGGQFAVGDRILFHEMVHNVDLFEVPVTTLYTGETTIPLDQSVYEGKGYTLEQLTITPLSLAIDGHYTVSSDQSWPEVSITLKDGTSFDLASIQNGYAYTACGTYGSLSSAGTSGGSTDDPFIRDTWMFSKALDLEQIDHITVDGVDYTLE